MIKNVLVTGGAGRLGNFVCPYLKSLGYNVSYTDVKAPDRESENMKARIPFIKADLLEIGEIMKAICFAQADAIVHLGAIPGSSELQPPYEEKELGPAPGGRSSMWRMDEDYTMKVNTMGMFYVADAARRLGVKNIVTTTSYYAYGQGGQIAGHPIDIKYLPIDEDHPCQPGDTYSLSKYLAEEIMKAFVRAYDMRCVALRLNGVFYYNTPFAKFVYKFPQNLPAQREHGTLTGGLAEHADARDISRFIGLVLEKMEGFDNMYECFNVWTATHFKDETAKVYRRLYPDLGDMVDNIKGYDGIFSIDKARKLLGYEPAYSWRDGNNAWTLENEADQSPANPF